MRTCKHCDTWLFRADAVYCSNECQGSFAYDVYIDKWKAGEVDGGRGQRTKALSAHIIRYLHSKYSACMLCGWAQVHSVTGRVPLEIDHIDGNSENNAEENLRLICPNCHSLSANFRNLNKGKGRRWRRSKPPEPLR